MNIWAHRGVSSRKPENTLEAFDAALRYRINGIELDVQLCKSGEVVVFHDATLERLYGFKLAIKDLTLSQLRQLAPIIPTLDEVFQRYDNDFEYILDLKARLLDSGQLEREVMKLVKKHRLEQHVILSGGLVSMLRLQYMQANVKLGYLIEHRLHLLGRKLLNTPLHINEKLLNSELISKLKSESFAIRAWTVNSPSRAAKLQEEGVEGFITDYPQDY